MALSSLSKHCLISGVLVSLFCLVYMVLIFIRVNENLYEKDENDDESDEIFVSETDWMAKLGFYAPVYMAAAGIFLNILMIFGILKRRILPMLPLYIIYLIGLPYAWGMLVFSYGYRSGRYQSVQIGVPVVIYMILAPFVAVLFEIRQDNAEKRKKQLRV